MERLTTGKVQREEAGYAAGVYLRPYDGWGARAAAPLLLPTLVLSAVRVPGEAPRLYHTLRDLRRA